MQSFVIKSPIAGELGPSNIVGSAAFNMLLITAVCVTALPPGDGRRIQNRVVFYVTSIFSVLSYVWLLVILEVLILPIGIKPPARQPHTCCLVEGQGRVYGGGSSITLKSA